MALRTVALLLTVVAPLALSAPASHALDLVDLGKAPAWYGREVVDVTQGKEVKRAVYSTEAIAISMADLNRILSAYGLDVVDAKRAPDGYLRETVTPENGREVRAIVFSGDAKGMAPVAVHAILSAYGVRVVDAKTLPPAYGHAVTKKNADGKDVEDVVLSSVAYVKSPAEWHRILSAYGN